MVSPSIIETEWIIVSYYGPPINYNSTQIQRYPSFAAKKNVSVSNSNCSTSQTIGIFVRGTYLKIDTCLRCPRI